MEHSCGHGGCFHYPVDGTSQQRSGWLEWPSSIYRMGGNGRSVPSACILLSVVMLYVVPLYCIVFLTSLRMFIAQYAP